ncbi:MAG: hypothetical protein KIT73_16980 [Burkholderiales bacterium]|nr:hypothetical protein [Burkholderiales bacterium]
MKRFWVLLLAGVAAPVLAGPTVHDESAHRVEYPVVIGEDVSSGHAVVEGVVTCDVVDAGPMDPMLLEYLEIHNLETANPVRAGLTPWSDAQVAN